MVSKGSRGMKRTVLFLCTGNSCRSQMAEGWLRHLAGGRFDVASAGTRPVGLNPGAVRVMREVGLDISSQRSSHVQEFSGRQFDYVVTVCDNAKESCPTFPTGTAMLHWSFDDPAAAKGSEEDRLVVFRRVRDEIKDRINMWTAALTDV